VQALIFVATLRVDQLESMKLSLSLQEI
jgi:hypothetical protein